MPGAERRDRYQPAVLREKTGTDDANEPILAEPVEIMVRWNTRRTQEVAPDGTLIALDATARVNQAIPIGSILWLGELVDWYGTGSRAVDSEHHEVVSYSETKDVKNRQATRRVGLVKFRDLEAEDG